MGITSHLPIEWWIIVCHGEVQRCSCYFQHIFITGAALETPPPIAFLIHGQSFQTWGQREQFLEHNHEDSSSKLCSEDQKAMLLFPHEEEMQRYHLKFWLEQDKTGCLQFQERLLHRISYCHTPETNIKCQCGI